MVSQRLLQLAACLCIIRVMLNYAGEAGNG